MLTYIIANDGTKLMPTTNIKKVRKLLKAKRARIVCRHPFTIQLNYKPTTAIKLQPIKSSMDAGHQTIGMSVKTPITGQRILVVSDIHFPLLEKEKSVIAENFDQCWLLGDIPREVIKNICETVNCKIVGVCGNHDTFDTFKGIEQVEDIHGKVLTINNLTLAGISGSSFYKENTPYCMLTQDFSVDVASEMDKGDVLLSHDSPYQVHSFSANKEGLKGISKYIDKQCPKLHIYGHHHAFRTYERSETLCICNYRLGIIEPDGMYHVVKY